MKKIGTIVIILFVFICVTGCGKKVTDGKEKELLPRPTVEEGVDVVIKDLKFYLPGEFKAKQNNGEGGIYEYYTGEYVEFGPTGIDVLIDHQLPIDNFDFEKYALKKSSGAIAKAKMEKIVINEHEWYKGKVKDDYYYFSYSAEGIYDIHIHKVEDNLGIYQDTITMFEDTLFFENRATK